MLSKQTKTDIRNVKVESPNAAVKKKENKLDKIFSAESKKTNSTYNIVNQEKSNVGLSCKVKKKKKSAEEKKSKEQKDVNSTLKEIIIPTVQIDITLDNANEEYDELSYKKSTSTPVKLNSNEKKENSGPRKKSADKDFRAKFKTEKCRYFEAGTECKFGQNCAFAHGDDDIRGKILLSTNYKTKRCKQFFDSGYCPYGVRCQFLHKDSFNTTDKLSLYSYSRKISDLINSLGSSEGNTPSEQKITRPRLKTFETLSGAVEESSLNSKLYEDILALKNEQFDETKEQRSRFMSA